MAEKKKKSVFFTKILFSYFVLLLLVLAVFMTVVFLSVLSENCSEARRNQQELTNRVAQQVDAYLTEIDQFAQQVMRSTRILNFFYNLQNEKDLSNHFDRDILNDIDLTSILHALNRTSPPMYRISVYNQYGDFIHTGAPTDKGSVLAQKLGDAEIYSRMVSLGYSDRPLIAPPGEDDWSEDNDGSYISVYRPLKNFYSTEACGLVEVQSRVAELESLLEFDTMRGMQVRIYSSGGVQIYPEENADEGGELYRTNSYSQTAGWRVELAQPTAALNRIRLEFVLLFLVVGLILVAFMFLLTYLIAQRITRPITRLRESVAGITLDDIRIEREETQEIDEIEQLGKTFDKMLLRLNQSLEHERRAYSLALQAQMNPHFLYNTLSVISAAGAEAGNEKVVGICVNASEMLRYIASFEGSYVSLSEELRHAENYLSLMKARYEDCFSYQIHATETARNLTVPKLIIQPLVENCFQHGFSGVEPPWEILIDVQIAPDEWSLAVEDNGGGIAEEQKTDILDKLRQNESGSLSLEELKIGGLGLVNTIIRLKLLYGDVSYDIENIAPHGTRVTLRGNGIAPRKEEADDQDDGCGG